MRKETLTELARNTGDVVARADRGPVLITRHDIGAYVILSFVDYYTLVGAAKSDE